MLYVAAAPADQPAPVVKRQSPAKFSARPVDKFSGIALRQIQPEAPKPRADGIRYKRIVCFFPDNSLKIRYAIPYTIADARIPLQPICLRTESANARLLVISESRNQRIAASAAWESFRRHARATFNSGKPNVRGERQIRQL
jgi:hypothetical protein